MASALPFDFWGGYVGYLGYGLKAECGGAACELPSDLPDAALFLADRCARFCCACGATWLLQSTVC